jgi:hypothetical protein
MYKINLDNAINVIAEKLRMTIEGKSARQRRRLPCSWNKNILQCMDYVNVMIKGLTILP